MTIGIRYAARSDVGMLREGNEDSAYAGAHLLAVADGMGGHVGGEIASAAAIGELRKLDTDMPADELLGALERTVKAANEKLSRMVESDPALQGMGTTLTAMLWSGSQVALVHIGDSRAYLLRDGSLYQITHDHTLVQSLVDEGRISPDEAASHPQRSLLLRALDGRGEVDPDLSLREAKVGDRYLLCSDGLSGVVTAETIFQVLTEYADPEDAVRQLIDLANRGGGPDNITCVVADVIELGPGQPPPQSSPLAVGAAANVSRTEPPDAGPAGPGGRPGGQPGGQAGGSAPPSPQGRQSDTPAGRAAQLRDTMPQPPVAVDEMPPPPPQAAAPMSEQQLMGRAAGSPPQETVRAPRRRWTWLIVAFGVVAVGLAGAGAFAVHSMRNDGYYATEEGGRIVVYKGRPESLAGLSLHTKASQQPNPPILVADLPQRLQMDLRNGVIDLKGPDGWRNLAQQVCRYTLQPDKDRVIIWRGLGQRQNGCDEEKVVESQIRLSDLPTSDQQRLLNGELTFPNRQQAEDKLKDLQKRRDACREPAATDIRDCPRAGQGGERS
ncbi:Stp1/IreP family PP2C-type Ser/Thr phosphatase [Thermomonospora catenispora]|uniref:Stp1/IreP family PP2C-type Ser/Thr phosphatase n=1 Tax=Thermomonospora catenispora TaxID=2493090 RepID=UPI0011233629|nr:Stp1/IreP family PP2C-type Ser/Thr phosphatase [Thermomonospora catenispora]TNY37778.1 Stp1/IreP family PP2C-type Ser/Thr phosphatase [Thermomonospora catenispora]